MKRTSCLALDNPTSSLFESYHPLTKRICLNSFDFSYESGLSVYERIFKMANHIRRSLKKNEKSQANRSMSACSRSSSFEQMFHPTLIPTHAKSNARGSRTVLSSTPFVKFSEQKASLFQSERCLYQRLLSEASTETPLQSYRATDTDTYATIVIDGSDDVSAPETSILRKCPLSPISPSRRTRSTSVDYINNGRSASPLLDSDARALTKFQPDPVDQQVQSWLKACEQTPYLSDQWLANLTTNYRVCAKQWARERQLAECKVRHWARQREMAHRQRTISLEQRLACLLLTPSVLKDPYLVPQPIPIELPYQPRKVASIAPCLPELNEAQLSQVETVLRTGPLDAIVTEKFNICVTRKELTTLAGSNWLSDVVINFYLQLLSERSHQQSSTDSTSLPRLAVLNTFFYTKLTAPSGAGYTGVRRWSRRLNLLDQDMVFIPIHDRGMHWCLACIDLKSKTITYYDSMGSSNDKCLRTLKSYLQNEYEDKKGHPLPDPESWKLINTEDTVPQQDNGSDCGVFLCTFGEFLSRRAPFTFSQNDMPGIRKRMMFEIITQQLLTTGFKLDFD